MKLAVLFGRAELEYPPEYGELEITKIVTDSRDAVEGCLFVCIEGLHVDGHGFVRDAIDAGACVIVAERVRDACVGGAAAYILLENTRRAAALLYHAWYNNPARQLKIIGVTGTNGKTSVSTLACELFEGVGYRCGLIGTVECRSGGRHLEQNRTAPDASLTTPDAAELYEMLAQMVSDGVEYVFMEVSSHALALGKVDAIEFEIAVFTNLTRDHLDFHGNMQAYFDAKRRLFSMCRKAVVFVDDAAGARLFEELSCPAVSCSLETGDFCALDVRSRGMSGSEYRLRTPTQEIAISIPLVGRFFVINSLLAAAVAGECGIDVRCLSKLLHSVKGAQGRMERIPIEDSFGFEILIDYAHTPDALEQVLHSLRDARRADQRIVLLFGCGGDRDRGKRKEMAIVASRLADEVIVTSDNCRGESPAQILGDILRGIDRERPYRVILNRHDAIVRAVMEARKGDILLLAGKGHERYEIGRDGKVPFDERQIIAEALQQRSLAGE